MTRTHEPPWRYIPPDKPADGGDKSMEFVDLAPGEDVELLTPDEAKKIGRLMLCAIGRSPDGSVSLTVYEDGRASTLETDAVGAQMLADMLTGRR